MAAAGKAKERLLQVSEYEVKRARADAVLKLNVSVAAC